MCVMQMLGLESVNTADSSLSQQLHPWQASGLVSLEFSLRIFTLNMQPYYSTLLGSPQIIQQIATTTSACS